MRLVVRDSAPETAFINIAYAPESEPRLLAYIASLSIFGFIPTAAISETGNPNRLQRIVDHINSCSVSLHDLTLDADAVRPPHYNLPFELGLAVAAHRDRGIPYVLVAQAPTLLDQTLSDLKGEDPLVHDGSPLGVFRAMTNAFAQHGAQPADFTRVFRATEREAARLRQSGYSSLYQRVTFDSLRRVAGATASRL